LAPLVAADPEGALVYEDESWSVGKAHGRRSWGVRSKAKWPRAFGPKQGEAVYLSLGRRSEQVLWRYAPRTNTMATIQWLTQLAQQYRAQRYLVVVWDNASWHKAAAVERWVKSHSPAAHQQD